MSRTPGAGKRQRLAAPPNPVLGLLALLTLTVAVLVVLALRPPAPDSHDGLSTTPAADPTSPTLPGTSPGGEPQPDATEEETSEPAPIALAVPTRVMAAGQGGQALARASVGTCETPGQLELSQDAGETWEPRNALPDAGATQILRVLVSDDGLIQVVALDTDCDPALFASSDAGVSWNGPLDPQRAWYFDPRSPEEVSTPGGTSPLPCQAVAFAATGSRGAALCADQTVTATADRGETWSDPLSIPGIIALNVADNDDYVMVLARRDGCHGVLTAELSDGSPDGPDHCLPADLDSGVMVAGEVVVARTGDRVHLWIGDTHHTSEQDGADWRP